MVPEHDPAGSASGASSEAGQPAASEGRWRRRMRWAGNTVGVLLLVVVLLPEPLVAPFIERAVERRQSDCVRMVGFEVVDAGPWPTVFFAATGRLSDVSTRADEVVFNRDFPIHDVLFRADEIGVAPLRFGTGDGDTEVRGGRSSATVRFADLQRALADIGVDATLRWDGARMLADVQVPVLGAVPTTVDWRGVDGDLELTFTALEVITLPSLRIAFPDPVAFDSLGPESDGVRIATTIDGTLESDAWGCDTTTGTG